MAARPGLPCDCGIIHPDVVNAVKEHLPPENHINALRDFFEAVGNETRVRILLALLQGELCVCDLATLANATKSSISHQLAKLRSLNVIKCRKEGRIVFYSIADDHITNILSMGLEHVAEYADEPNDNQTNRIDPNTE